MVSSFVCINLIVEWTITHSFLFLCSIFICIYSFDNFSSPLVDSITSESRGDVTCDSLGDVTWSHSPHDVRDPSGRSDGSRIRKPHEGDQNYMVMSTKRFPHSRSIRPPQRISDIMSTVTPRQVPPGLRLSQVISPWLSVVTHSQCVSEYRQIYTHTYTNTHTHTHAHPGGEGSDAAADHSDYRSTGSFWDMESTYTNQPVSF